MAAEKCTDKKCPFHSSLRTRGRVFVGNVIATKMQHTAKIEWPYLFYLPKYERYEKRRTRVYAHIPACISVKVGDKVKIAECKPISKTVHFVILEKL
ncbi:MAG: 30S ribosomal protein S17 [Candidatus Nanoarchaeia archaeon]